MPFRDEGDAARARADALERELQDAKGEIERLRAGKPPPAEPPRARSAAWSPGAWAAFAIAFAALGIGMQSLDPDPPTDVLLPIVGACLLLAVVGTIATAMLSLRHRAGLHEALVVSGVKRVGPDGVARGYRVIGPGGIVVRRPIVERVDRLDLTPVHRPFELPNIYTSDGAVRIEAVATVAIARSPPRIYHAVERFLGRSAEEVAAVGVQTLEGVLRSATAPLTTAEVATSPEAFVRHVLELGQHAGDDLGLVLGLEVLRVEILARPRS